jgi:hypothetical protein
VAALVEARRKKVRAWLWAGSAPARSLSERKAMKGVAWT